jgi:hypothetical protein
MLLVGYVGPNVRAEREICLTHDPSDGHAARRHAAMCHFA